MAQAVASSSSVKSNAPNKFQYLGLCLIDALEDENLHTLEMLLKKHMSNPNVIVEAKGYAAVHLVCGLENRSFSLEAAKMIFDESGGDPNIPTFECMVTPMHIAAANGNAQVFQLMLKHGGNIEAEDTEGATPLVYAVREKYHYDVVMIAQNFLMEQKVERKRREAEERRFLSPAVHNRITMTPQGVPANFDPTSPFYINITHRRKTPGKIPSISVTPSEMEDKENTPVTPKKVNLFELTQTNLEEYSRLFTRSSTKESFIDSWRAKVTMSSSRGSLTRNIEVMEKILFSFDDTTDESFHTTNTSAFFTANSGDASTDDSQLIRRSPRNSQGSSVQLMEGFKHQDADNEISFYELRFHPLKPDAAPKSDGDSNSSTSTVLQLATDYDTDVLRADLTAFGAPPGPITKTTKKLYVKKLREYKAQPQLAEVAMQKRSNVPNFSVELINSLPMRDFNIHLVQYLKLEQDMMQDIRGSTKKWREGNLKTSFIYFLIDPRISQNLPAAVSQMSIEDVWMRFLQSIFYVGKGKSSRPYAHLYDAIKQFEVCYLNNGGGERGDAGSRKFNRIMDIWDADMGVVCLHVFHSIIPVEAYTREAAIIDCLGLQHLTNLKRGDYYGITSSWPMRMKKHMGIALLFKALQVFLAEGETQVSPRDLL